MLFILSGPSYVGKKTAITHFVKLFSFASVIPYTTKEKKRAETDGIQYHYLPQQYMEDHSYEFYFDRPFNTDEFPDQTIYAYKKADIEKAIESYSNFIIHASANTAIQIHSAYKNQPEKVEHLFTIFLDYSSELTQNIFESKCPFPRNEKNENSFLRKYRHAEKERKEYRTNSSSFNVRITSDNPYELCERIEDYILPKLTVMPTAPDRIPGPLSDEDIVYMAFKRRNNPLKVTLQGKGELDESSLKSILSGCGMHITLSTSIRRIVKKPFGNYIDMNLDEANMDAFLTKLYPEVNISLGYLLKPKETILCSSNETVLVPKDVYAIVASRFSYSQLGLTVELGTSVIQAGHNGVIHFQIHNNTDNYIYIYPNISIAQLLFYRTIHPSSKSYHEFENTHNYDATPSPPLSRFRSSNSSLDHVLSPRKTASKVIFDTVNAKLPNAIVGLFVSILLIALGLNIFPSGIKALLSTAQTAFSSLILPVNTLWRCIGIVIIIELIRCLLTIIGRTAIFVINKVLYAGRKNKNE